MKKIIIAAVALIVAGTGLYYFYLRDLTKKDSGSAPEQNTKTEEVQNTESTSEENAKDNVPAAEGAKPSVIQTPAQENKSETIIGKSAGGYDIAAYHFGSGTKEVLLVGGIHGGYSWNTSLLAYQLIDLMSANPSVVPAGVKVTIIPVLNPDGLSKVVEATGRFKPSDVSAAPELRTAGRFNANNVDLNRNFDCNWKAAATWQNKTVSGGASVFSESESMAIRSYAQNPGLTAVVAWYSAGGGVYSSSCGNGILPETQTITDIYANASGYTAYKNFESYQVSGDMTDWFAKNNVPAIGVLLTTSDDVDWEKNLAGIKALLEHYAK